MSPGRVIFRLRCGAEHDENIVAKALDDGGFVGADDPSCCAFLKASRRSA